MHDVTVYLHGRVPTDAAAAAASVFQNRFPVATRDLNFYSFRAKRCSFNSMEVIRSLDYMQLHFNSANPPQPVYGDRPFARLKAVDLCHWRDSSRRPRSSLTSCTGNDRLRRRRHCL